MSDKSFVAAAKVEDLPDGTKMVVEISGKPVLLCHTAGNIYAVTNICSHAEEALDCGRMRNGWISCPVHGARFDLETGNPINPPATQPIATYTVRIVDGVIEVAL